MKTEPNASSPNKSATEMQAADLVVHCLEREGVDTVFAYPGGASLEIHQALTRTKKIRTILPRHEQGGAYAAEAYGRATGKPGVCISTSGPGATNMITSIADAYMDSIPMVAITGQVFRQFIGKSAFQETDIFGITLPIVKHSYLVMDPYDIPRIIKEAFYIAQSGRPGPVLIDIPKDVQQAIIKPVFPENVEIPGYVPDKRATDEQLQKVMDLIAQAKQPILYVGGGILSSCVGCEELLKFAEYFRIPVATTLMGLSSFPETHELSVRWLGMHGAVPANWAVDQSDLLLAFGVRFDDRVTGKVSEYAKRATIVHIDIDESEHQKNKIVQYPIVSDIGFALKRINEIASKQKAIKPDTKEWLEKISSWKKEYAFSYEESPHILPQQAIEVLYELTKGDAIITTGVGQHQMWAAQFFKFDQPRTWSSSLGLGAMGYGYPAALGAKAAFPEKQVIDIDGDGSFVMNIQELATAKIEKLNVKAMILNNQHLGMVVQWEDRFYQSNRAHTILGDVNNIGSPDNLSGIYPDFVKIAEGFDVKARRVVKKEELREAIQEMLDHDGPYVLDVIVPYTEHVLPMIPAGKTVQDMIIK